MERKKKNQKIANFGGRAKQNWPFWMFWSKNRQFFFFMKTGVSGVSQTDFGTKNRYSLLKCTIMAAGSRNSGECCAFFFSNWKSGVFNGSSKIAHVLGVCIAIGAFKQNHRVFRWMSHGTQRATCFWRQMTQWWPLRFIIEQSTHAGKFALEFCSWQFALEIWWFLAQAVSGAKWHNGSLKKRAKWHNGPKWHNGAAEKISRLFNVKKNPKVQMERKKKNQKIANFGGGAKQNWPFWMFWSKNRRFFFFMKTGVRGLANGLRHKK